VKSTATNVNSQYTHLEKQKGTEMGVMKLNINEGHELKKIKYLIKYPYHLTACYSVTYHPNNQGCMKHMLCSVWCMIRKHYYSCSTLWKSSKIHIILRL